MLERVMGIEPTQSAWKAEVLPLNYTRNFTDARAPPTRQTSLGLILHRQAVDERIPAVAVAAAAAPFMNFLCKAVGVPF